MNYPRVAWEYSISDLNLLKLIDILESEHMFLDLESKLTKYAPSGWKDDVRIFFMKFRPFLCRFRLVSYLFLSKTLIIPLKHQLISCFSIS